jgi:hypothetical protein
MIYKIHVEEDWAWADEHKDTVHAVLQAHMPLITPIRDATPDEDMQRNMDIVIETARVAVCLRVRRPTVFQRDLTIRYQRRSGVPTEYSKLAHGFGDVYLYAWSNGKIGFKDWMLVNLSHLRTNGITLYSGPRWNDDGGSSFVWWSRATLYQAGTLICFKDNCCHLETSPQALPIQSHRPPVTSSPPPPQLRFNI